MADKPLDVYLNDHLAGATFGGELARQIESQMTGTEREARFRDLADQVEQDRDSLLELMERLGTTRNPVKQATTWVSEKASRVKLGERRLLHGGAGLFMAIETLRLGVEGKLCLWRMLREVGDRYSALDDGALATLIARAEAQCELLERERIEAGRRLFAADPPEPRS